MSSEVNEQKEKKSCNSDVNLKELTKAVKALRNEKAALQKKLDEETTQRKEAEKEQGQMRTELESLRVALAPLSRENERLRTAAEAAAALTSRQTSVCEVQTSSIAVSHASTGTSSPIAVDAGIATDDDPPSPSPVLVSSSSSSSSSNAEGNSTTRPLRLSLISPTDSPRLCASPLHAAHQGIQASLPVPGSAETSSNETQTTATDSASPGLSTSQTHTQTETTTTTTTTQTPTHRVHLRRRWDWPMAEAEEAAGEGGHLEEGGDLRNLFFGQQEGPPGALPIEVAPPPRVPGVDIEVQTEGAPLGGFGAPTEGNVTTRSNTSAGRTQRGEEGDVETERGSISIEGDGAPPIFSVGPFSATQTTQTETDSHPLTVIPVEGGASSSSSSSSSVAVVCAEVQTHPRTDFLHQGGVGVVATSEGEVQTETCERSEQDIQTDSEPPAHSPSVHGVCGDSRHAHAQTDQPELSTATEGRRDTVAVKGREEGSQTLLPETGQRETQTEAIDVRAVTADNNAQTEVAETFGRDSQTVISSLVPPSDGIVQTDSARVSEEGLQTDPMPQVDGGVQTESPPAAVDADLQTNGPDTYTRGMQACAEEGESETQTEVLEVREMPTQTETERGCDKQTETGRRLVQVYLEKGRQEARREGQARKENELGDLRARVKELSAQVDRISAESREELKAAAAEGERLRKEMNWGITEHLNARALERNREAAARQSLQRKLEEEQNERSTLQRTVDSLKKSLEEERRLRADTDRERESVLSRLMTREEELREGLEAGERNRCVRNSLSSDLAGVLNFLSARSAALQREEGKECLEGNEGEGERGESLPLALGGSGLLDSEPGLKNHTEGERKEEDGLSHLSPWPPGSVRKPPPPTNHSPKRSNKKEKINRGPSGRTSKSSPTLSPKTPPASVPGDTTGNTSSTKFPASKSTVKGGKTVSASGPFSRSPCSSISANASSSLASVPMSLLSKVLPRLSAHHDFSSSSSSKKGRDQRPNPGTGPRTGAGTGKEEGKGTPEGERRPKGCQRTQQKAKEPGTPQSDPLDEGKNEKESVGAAGEREEEGASEEIVLVSVSFEGLEGSVEMRLADLPQTAAHRFMRQNNLCEGSGPESACGDSRCSSVARLLERLEGRVRCEEGPGGEAVYVGVTVQRVDLTQVLQGDPSVLDPDSVYQKSGPRDCVDETGEESRVRTVEGAEKLEDTKEHQMSGRESSEDSPEMPRSPDLRIAPHGAPGKGEGEGREQQEQQGTLTSTSNANASMQEVMGCGGSFLPPVCGLPRGVGGVSRTPVPVLSALAGDRGGDPGDEGEVVGGEGPASLSLADVPENNEEEEEGDETEEVLLASLRFDGFDKALELRSMDSPEDSVRLWLKDTNALENGMGMGSEGVEEEEDTGIGGGRQGKLKAVTERALVALLSEVEAERVDWSALPFVKEGLSFEDLLNGVQSGEKGGAALANRLFD